MISSPDPFNDLFDSSGQWDPYANSSRRPTQTNQLQLCPFLYLDSERLYNEESPIYIHYSVEWKVTVNSRAIIPKDTEQDIILVLAAF